MSFWGVDRKCVIVLYAFILDIPLRRAEILKH